MPENYSPQVEKLAENIRKSLYLCDSETPNATVYQIADAVAESILREFEVTKR